VVDDKFVGVLEFVSSFDNPLERARETAGLTWAVGLSKERVYLGSYQNETAHHATWFVPQAHYLEAWGDARSYDGTASIVQPLIDKQAGYTVKSFTPICQTFKNDQVAVVPPNSPLKTARDIVEATKRKPGGLNVAIPGIATIPHLAMIAWADQAKVVFNDVPYKGPAEEMQAVRSGQIDFAVVPLTAAAGSGLSMPGLFAEGRNPALPNVPTFKEQGYDVAPLSYGGLLGPAGMPADVTAKLEAACVAVMKGDAAQKVVKHTLQPAGYFADSAGFARNLATDRAEKNRLVPLLQPQ